MGVRREEECEALCNHHASCELRLIRILLEAFFDTTYGNDPIAPRLPEDWEDRKTYADMICGKVVNRPTPWGGMNA